MRGHTKALVAITAMFVLLGASTALALQTHKSPDDPGAGTFYVKAADVPGGTCCFAGMAVDQDGGELYALDQLDPATFAFGKLHRFGADGSYEATFTLEESLSSPQDVAIDNSGTGSDGAIYVTDTGNNRIAAIDSSGALIASFGTGGRINGAEDVPGDPDTTLAGGLSSPCGVAVDQSNGNLFVADSGNNRIWIFDSTGAYLGRVADSALQGPCGLAFDSSGELYVRNGNCFCHAHDGDVLRFHRSGPTAYELAAVLYATPDNETPTEPFDDGPYASDVAVDTSNDHVYVNLGDRIREYESSGGEVMSFGQGLCCSTGLAIDPANERLYASDGGAIRTFSTQPTILPEATTGAAENVTGETATLKGTVDPAGGAEVQCVFEYGPDESYGSTAPCEPAGPHTESTAVSADLTGLTPATAYHYRLHVTNSEGEEGFGADRSFATDGPPVVESFFVTDVSETRAEFKVHLNPSGTETSYRFEYVTKAEFEASGFANATAVPVPDASVGSGSTGVSVSQVADGLSPATAYAFRILATNAIGTVESAAKSFTTFPSLSAPAPGRFPGKGFLPHDRAWEMVSPPDKSGGDLMPESTRTRASVDGERVGFISMRAFADAQGTAIAVDYLAERSSDPNPGHNGWATHAITPKQEPMPFTAAGSTLFEPKYEHEFSPDLSTGILRTWSPLTADPNVEDVPNFYRRDDLHSPGPGSYELITTCPLCESTGTPLPPLSRFPALGVLLVSKLAYSSPDLRHVIFESRQRLTGDTPLQAPGRGRLYQWDEGVTRLAGRIPEAPATFCDDAEGPPCVAADLSIAGQGAGGNGNGFKLTPHTLSDGSDGHLRVFFTRPTGDGTTLAPSGIAGNLYMRLDHTSTAQLNASERTDCAGDASCGGDGEPDPAPAGFAPATYYEAATDGSRVFFTTGEALTDDAPAGSEKLYMYDTTKPTSAPDNLTLISGGKEVRAVIGASADGHYVYFMAEGEIYLWHEGQITHVSALWDSNGENSLRFALGEERMARITPDGRHLLFSSANGEGILSAKGGTDYDHGSDCSGPQGACREFYLYSAEEDTLECASCNPSGAPASRMAFTSVRERTGPVNTTMRVSHALSDDGRYAFFTTGERLVGADINGQDDAYVYDSATGKASLLSSGESGDQSYFLDASADGSDAFFITTERLSGWDVDGNYDLYDARVGGGFPEPPAPPPSCQGDGCQPAPTVLNETSPASEGFRGPGDPKARKPRSRCTKNQRRVKTRRGKTRCVKKRQAKKQRQAKNRTANANRRAGR